MISFNPILNSDTDVDGDTLVITSVTAVTSKGTASYSGSNIIYTPNLNAVGSDSLSYTISDGNGGTASATVSITIIVTDQPPVVISPIKLEAIKNKSFSFDLGYHVQDESKNTLVYELLNPNDIPGLSISSVGVISSSNVGGILGDKDFSVNITDSFNHIVTVNMSLFVVEIFLNPNGIVEINNSKITIAASGLGDTLMALPHFTENISKG